MSRFIAHLDFLGFRKDIVLESDYPLWHVSILSSNPSEKPYQPNFGQLTFRKGRLIEKVKEGDITTYHYAYNWDGEWPKMKEIA